MSKTVIEITGMTCSHCEQSVAKELSGLSGVVSASADHATGTATVEATAVSEQELADAVEEAGYKAVGFQTLDA
ncbi:MAG: heavy-metal-associated domain-containing protein [Aquiluna sp.]|nr:heavy-metal-associated domain-containing protein [Aquiluna sp.]